MSDIYDSAAGGLMFVPNRCSFETLAATVPNASLRVYGGSLSALKIGLNIRPRKDFRVFGALRTVMEDMVVGSVDSRSS